jgi:hypothetical protein
MNAADLIFAAASAKLGDLQPLTLPPKVPIVLWQEDTRTIYVEEALGPAVPYGPVLREDSESNYGYMRLKGHPDLVNAVPELAAWPEYAETIRKINGDSTSIETVGCAVGFFSVTGQPPITDRVGSYVDIVFSDPSKAEAASAYLALAAELMAYVAECQKWWSSVEIGLQRLRHLPNTASPLGIVLRVSGSGRSKEEARQCFRASLRKLDAAVEGRACAGAV